MEVFIFQDHATTYFLNESYDIFVAGDECNSQVCVFELNRLYNMFFRDPAIAYQDNILQICVKSLM